MNRLIILGNGFDLAHGLPTRYSDFLSYYYSSIKRSDYNDDFYHFKRFGHDLSGLSTISSIQQKLAENCGTMVMAAHPHNHLRFNGVELVEIKNLFFYEVSEKCDLQWVDIENEYFAYLLKSLSNHPKAKRNIKDLNAEIDVLATRFAEYLKEQICPLIKERHFDRMAEHFRTEKISNENELNSFLKEFPENVSREVKHYFDDGFFKGQSLNKFNRTLILNFNYTDTAAQLYCKGQEILNIHGNLFDPENPINMGFGDEANKRYADIEDTNDNEYLRLMKSTAYSQTDNYRKLFNWIEAHDFQVQIMGHSCGISDRTMLKAIFENSRCKSIKIFFHQYAQAHNGCFDNHSEIVRNISRHFSNKVKMREKIVNRTLSCELPQI